MLNYAINWLLEPSKERFQQETFLLYLPTFVMSQNHKSTQPLHTCTTVDTHNSHITNTYSFC